MPEWDAEVAIDGELVRALVSEQFPELDASSARLLAEGWDNAVWVVEERLAFRFPRRAVAAALVEREIAALSRLEPLVPVAVPKPVHVGSPGRGYPWAFFGSPLLPGIELAEASPPDDERVALGRELGRFLRVLHAPETRRRVDPEAALPCDPNRRADMPFRVARVRERLTALAGQGLWTAPRSVERVLTEAERLPPAEGPVAVAHGDLHLRHVLVEDGALAGVIDWGDVCLADPAVDLVLYWSALPPAGRAAFVAEYGEAGEERRLRARVLSLFLGAILALYARDVGNAGLERESLAGLDRTLLD